MWLEKMGIYGMDKIEDIIMAGIATGDPVLFIGSHGTAKTTLCRKLAEALGLKFFAYDASKALFEDLIGFPNPDTISKGEIEYVPTKLSIWDKEFILIDEISRARAEMQNKWLEIVRSRQVMGLKAEKLRHIFAAMNPPSYAGANPLDEALAGRFAFVIKVPQAIEMTDANLRKIINNINEDDGAAIYKGNEMKMDEKERQDFLAYIEAIRDRIGFVSKKLNSRLDDYIIKFVFFANNKGINLDGRRINMIKRNIAAYISTAILKEKQENFDLMDMREEIFTAVKYSMPFEAINVELTNMRIKYIHDMAFDLIDDNGANRVFDLKNPQDAENLTRETVENNYPFIKAGITKIIEKVKNSNCLDEKPINMAILRVLAGKIASGELKFQMNETERLFETYRSMFDMSVGKKFHYSGLQHFGEMVKRGIIDDELSDINDFKVVFNTLRDPDRDDTDIEKLAKALSTYKNYPGMEE